MSVPARLAAIHADTFPRDEAWGEGALRTMLEMPGAILAAEGEDGFLLARAAGGEAEILTLAVRPAARRRGVARRLLGSAAAAARSLGAAALFLEVAADNAPALALYGQAGFAPVGLRRNYYGPGRDARVLRLSLS
ncbi:GNAT family N-acetyltransferase [Roseococcus sp. DSY-14]|uniref:GNAT family N-acetyltransferase n=1 Tax=Roseococcus sp. DSY-14 TaxID=3369650 RepID=UPI00387B6592